MATNTNKKKRMMALSQDKEEDLLCPVCLKYFTSPISLCHSGHNTCGVCRPTLHQCSICNSPFSDIRNLALENVISGIKYHCINADEGCSRILAADQIESHEEICLKGPIKCPVNKFPNVKCPWSGHIKDFKKHATAGPLNRPKHAHTYLTAVMSKVNTVDNLLIFGYDEAFLHYKVKRENVWYFTVMLVGSAAQAAKYKIIHTFTEKNGPNEIVFTTGVKHYEEDFDTIINKNDCCHINSSLAQKFYKTGTSLIEFEVNILKQHLAVASSVD